jgi:hypothetical protein
MKNLLRLTALASLLSLPLISSDAQAVSFGGHATGAQVTVPATGTIIRATSGTLPISGGGADAFLLVGDIPGDLTAGAVSLSAGTLHSAIVGLDATRAEASMANVALTVSGNQITADFLIARSTASCGPAVAGSSELANIVINGEAITVTGAPNQTVALPNGTVIFNEQLPSVVGTSAELTVTALHVTTSDVVTGQQLADVLLSTVDAKIDCQPGSGPPGSFTSGGGWIPAPTAGKGTFGVFGEDGTTRGHLVYIDHNIDLRVTSTSITTVITAGCQTQIQGQGDSNTFGPVGFTVRVTDSAEPGTGSDTFEIEVTSGGTLVYTAGPALLGGGNIQVHPPQTCP